MRVVRHSRFHGRTATRWCDARSDCTFTFVRVCPVCVYFGDMYHVAKMSKKWHNDIIATLHIVRTYISQCEWAGSIMSHHNNHCLPMVNVCSDMYPYTAALLVPTLILFAVDVVQNHHLDTNDGTDMFSSAPVLLDVHHPKAIGASGCAIQRTCDTGTQRRCIAVPRSRRLEYGAARPID